MRWTRSLYAPANRLVTGRLGSVLTGLVCGTAAAFGFSLTIGSVGLSVPVYIGIVLATALLLDAARRARVAEWLCAPMSLAGGLLVWVLVAPWIAEASVRATGLLGPGFVTSVLAGFLVAGGCAAIPLVCGLMSVRHEQRSASRLLMVGGFALAVVACPFLPPAWCGAQTLALVTVAAWLVGQVLVRFTNQPEAETEEVLPQSHPGYSGSRLLVGSLLLVLGGASTAILSRILNQTMAASAQTLFGGAAVWVVCAAIGERVARSRGRLAALGSPAVAAAMCVLAVASTVLLFPVVVSVQLKLNAEVSYPVTLFLLRLCVVAAVLVGPAFTCGAALSRFGSFGSRAVGFPATVFGLSVLLPLAVVQVGTPIVVCLLAAIGAAIVLASPRLSGSGWLPAGRGGVPAAAAAVLAAGLLPFGTGRLCIANASTLLFSSSVFQEVARGTDSELLLAANEVRLLDTDEEASGITTAWRLGGAQVQLRRNGVPVGLTSTDPLRCPQPVTATLPVIMPLLMHGLPEDVLLLGDCGAAAEAACLVFPLRSVTAVDLNERTSDEADRVFAMRRDDERFREIKADPATAVAALSGSYDIIVARPPQAALPASAVYYTTEHIQRAAARLKPGGLFCQSFRQIDFGSVPLRQLLASFARAFPTVSAVQLESGEILVVASSGETVIHSGMAQRAARGHVRRLLDDLGWDYSRVLGLASLDPEAVAAILSTWKSEVTAANAAFLWGLPVETMRWGPKQTEIRVDLASYQRRIVDQLEKDDHRDEAARRIAELSTEAEVLFGFPDVPWVYRKTLRTRLEQNPRPPQEVVVRGEVRRELHEVDKYRIEYLKALSKAIKSASSDRDALAKLEQFVNPTEPLLSYFASHEAARICGKIGDASGELRHRLRTIYFAPAGTRSVRDVVATINLLVDQPQVIADPTRRWDQMNSLMQVLMARWAARSNIAPGSSRVAINDIDKCLAAIETGLSALRDWQAEAGIEVALVQRRERYLRRRLERPLARYRDELLPHHYKRDAEAMAADDEAIDSFRPLGN